LFVAHYPSWSTAFSACGWPADDVFPVVAGAAVTEKDEPCSYPLYHLSLYYLYSAPCRLHKRIAEPPITIQIFSGVPGVPLFCAAVAFPDAQLFGV